MSEFDERGARFDDFGRPILDGVTWWDGDGVTIPALYDEVIRLAEESPDTRKLCRYNSEGTPECIVGQAVFNLTGKVVNDDTHGGAIDNASAWHAALGIRLDERYVSVADNEADEMKFRFVKSVQRSQDADYTWGVALAHARDAFGEI